MSEKKPIRIVKKGEKIRPVVKAKTNTARETAQAMNLSDGVVME